MIEVPNPIQGAVEYPQAPTMCIFRPWTLNDMKKAAESITSYKDNVAEWETGVRGLIQSYHLNGAEVQRLFMLFLRHDWYTVRGTYTGMTAAGLVIQPDSFDLNGESGPDSMQKHIPVPPRLDQNQ